MLDICIKRMLVNTQRDESYTRDLLHKSMSEFTSQQVNMKLHEQMEVIKKIILRTLYKA